MWLHEAAIKLDVSHSNFKADITVFNSNCHNEAGVTYTFSICPFNSEVRGLGHPNMDTAAGQMIAGTWTLSACVLCFFLIKYMFSLAHTKMFLELKNY